MVGIFLFIGLHQIFSAKTTNLDNHRIIAIKIRRNLPTNQLKFFGWKYSINLIAWPLCIRLSIF
jgi:hypothetical protein